MVRERLVAPGSVLRNLSLDRRVEDAILALDPERLSEHEIWELLSHGPAPRIINIHGSVPIITMKSFSKFLIAMGYPKEKIRNPKDGAYSYSSYQSSKQLAGLLAWYYEREGMMPMLIGHSQGGMLVIKVLHELAGAFNDRIPLWNPLTEDAEDRLLLIDPLTGAERPVIGLTVSYAAAIATGKLMRLLLGQWEMLSRLRKIPDTVKEFTGFSSEWDLLAGNFGRVEPYHPLGSARVRNVTLPSEGSHITLPLTEHLATGTATRGWISSYTAEGSSPPLVDGVGLESKNILLAAEIWYSVKKHWCLEAQRLIRAKRTPLSSSPPLLRFAKQSVGG
jgi:hypothetical protein